MISKIKDMLKKQMPEKFKELIKLIVVRESIWKKTKELKSTKMGKRIILIGTPVHGNLGDHAIAEAEKKFLNEHLGGYKIIEIITPLYRVCKNVIKKYSTQNDIIIISGGGWLGNLWKHNEDMVREIIKDYRNNKIIILPQTVYYEENDNYLADIECAKEIYSAHENLIICLRDKQSYDFIKNNKFSKYDEKILFVPDIVLYLNKSNSLGEVRKSEKILLCLRDDLEKSFEREEEKQLQQFFNQKLENIQYTNTVVPYLIPLYKREKELDKKYNEFKNAQIVITDRLHGMLFATITGTPCIAFDNITGKVKGVYKWIEDVKYIKYVENVEEMMKEFEYIKSLDKNVYENSEIKLKFDKIIKNIEK